MSGRVLGEWSSRFRPCVVEEGAGALCGGGFGAVRL